MSEPASPAPVPVLLPDLGSAQVVLSLWFASVGDFVDQGDRLVEIVMPGATFDVSAPVSGRLTAIQAWPHARLVPEQVLGLVVPE